MSDHPFSVDVYQPNLGEEVELFIVDCSGITGSGSDVFYLCSSADFSAPVKWKNLAGDALVEYTPVPIKAEGFEAKSEGVLPRPKFSISNVEMTSGAMVGILFSLVYSNSDILGARLIRYRTLGKYLGDLSYADAHYPEDIYLFNQKLNHNYQYIEWELAPDFDVQGMKLPRRLILRDVCQLRYRTYSGSGYTFTYDATENKCPMDTQRILLNATGDFSSATNWTCGTGWSIAGSKATKTPGTASYLYSGTDVAGVTTVQGTYTNASDVYTLWVDVTRSAGTLTAELIENGESGGTVSISTTAVHQISLTAPANYDNAHLAFYADASFSGSINLIVMEYFLDGTDQHSGLVDVCSHTLYACRLRWPNQSRPYSGFPSVGRVRV